jgi:hypothetical protein
VKKAHKKEFKRQMDLTSHLGEDNQAPLKKAQVNNNIKTEDINPDNKQDT